MRWPRLGAGRDQTRHDPDASLTEIAPKFLPYVDGLAAARRGAAAGKRILFEGAQGALLDVDHGTYPFVTSSNTVPRKRRPGPAWAPARSAMCSACKAYTTRVGKGPFPTDSATKSARARTRGQEFGVVTGRERRCGWFDACWSGRSAPAASTASR